MKLIMFFLMNFCFLCAYAQETVPESIYDFKIKAHGGGLIDLAHYKGKKILIVNTTCQNEYSPQYQQLDTTYQKFMDKLIVIGFLTEDFQTEPGSKKNRDISNKVYNVSFPLTEKVSVRGENMSPVYKWLTEKKYNKLKDSEIKWDFQKYLIDEKGNLIAEFDPKIIATSSIVTGAIER